MRRSLALFLFLFVTVGAGAQVFDSSVKIVYFHADNHAEVQTVKGSVRQSVDLNTDKKLEVRVPQTVRIEIGDPNPVFFKYAKGKTTFAPNPDYAAALAFAKAVKSVPDFLHLQAAVPNQFDAAVVRLADLIETMPVVARQTLGDSQDIASAKATVRSWNLESLEMALSSTDDAAQSTATPPSDSTSDLLKGVPANEGFQKLPQPGQPTPQPHQPVPVTQKTPEQLALDDALERVKTLEKKLGAEDARRKHDKLAVEAKAHLETLKQFRDAVLGVNVPIPLEAEAVDVEQNPTVHLKIDRLSGFPAIDTTSRKTGDIAVPLQAYSPVHLSFGPAVVYSFVKAPVFSAEKQTDGTLKITEKRENRAQNVSAMLTITPRPWSDKTFGGAFQLGLNPVKDQIGLFTGVEIHISQLVKFGAGYAFQQVPKLDGSLVVGGTIASPDALKTSTHFKSGAYVAMTLSLPKEKE